MHKLRLSPSSVFVLVYLLSCVIIAQNRKAILIFIEGLLGCSLFETQFMNFLEGAYGALIMFGSIILFVVFFSLSYLNMPYLKKYAYVCLFIFITLEFFGMVFYAAHRELERVIN